MAIRVSPRTLQYQVKRGRLSEEVAKRVGEYYALPRRQILELVSSL